MRIRSGSASARQHFDVLEYEILQEKSATLARLGRRLDEALRALADWDAAPPPESDPEGARHRDRLVAAAGEALWYYVVQREVCGLHGTDALLEILGVPGEVRLRMGVRPPTPPSP